MHGVRSGAVRGTLTLLPGDLSGLFERKLCHGRADQLVDQRAAEDDRADLRGVLRDDLPRGQRQADGHAGLRQQARAEELADVGVAPAHCAADQRADVFADHAQDDVDRADHADSRQNAELQIRAGGDKEQHKDRRRDAVANVHDLVDIGREIRDDGAHGHAQQQVGKPQPFGQTQPGEDKADDDGQAVALFLKEAQRDQEQEAKHRADQQRAADLLERREQGGGERARADDGLRDGDGQREQDQGGRVVDGDDGQQRLGNGAARAVLLDDHDGRGRGGRGGNGAEHQRERDLLTGDDEAEHDEDHREQRLHAGDHDRRGADALEIAQLELIADGKGNEAERDLGDDVDRGQKILRQQSEDARADEQTGNEIAGDVGQMHELGGAPHEHTAEDHDTKVEQNIRDHLCVIPSTRSIGRVKRMPESG